MILSNFEKNFYHESPAVQSRPIPEIQQFLINNQITIDGNAPRPIFNFNEINFPGKKNFLPKNNKQTNSSFSFQNLSWKQSINLASKNLH
jgi:hypothetical protein